MNKKIKMKKAKNFSKILIKKMNKIKFLLMKKIFMIKENKIKRKQLNYITLAMNNMKKLITK